MKIKYIFLKTILVFTCFIYFTNCRHSTGTNTGSNTGGSTGSTDTIPNTSIVYSNSADFTIDTVTLGLEKLVSVGNGIYKKDFYTKFNVERTIASDFKVFDIIFDTITVTHVILGEKFQISYIQNDSLLQIKLAKGFSQGEYHYIYPDDSNFPKEFTVKIK